MTTDNRNSTIDRRGFSLMELLVVIAIVAVLIAITVPSLTRAKQFTRVVICKNNLKNIHAACELYLTANDDYFFQGQNASFLFGGREVVNYEGEFRPFNEHLGIDPVRATARDAKVFRCPDDNGRKNQDAQVFFDEQGTSYQTNIFLIGQPQASGGIVQPLRDELNKRLSRLNRSKVERPGELVLAGDFEWATRWQWRNGEPEGTAWHYRQDYFCVVFLDGHAAYLPIRKGAMYGTGYTVLPFSDLTKYAPQPTEP